MRSTFCCSHGSRVVPLFLRPKWTVMEGLSWSATPPDAFKHQMITVDTPPPQDDFKQRRITSDTTPPPDAFKRQRTTTDTLNRLASFIAKQHSHAKTCRTPPSLPPRPPPLRAEAEWVCPESGQSFPCAQSVLPKPHRCSGCGTEFSLRSSLQLHNCDMFQRGKLNSPSYATALIQQETSNAVDRSPYACAPCGRGFMLKQALLHHQQADCGKAASPPFSDGAPSPVSPASEEEDSASSSGSLYIQDHQCKRDEVKCLEDADSWESEGCVETKSKRKMFSCRSCEMVFCSTAKLSKHRREQHRRGLKLTADSQRPAAKHRRYNATNNTYTCQVCSQVFLHHLSLWAHKKKHPALQNGKDKCSNINNNNASNCKLLLKPKKLAPSKALAQGKAKKFHKFHKTYKQLNPLTRSRVRKHEVYHQEDFEEFEEQEFPCPSCPEVFSRHSDLSVHAELHQAAVRRSRCSVCEREMDSRRWSGSSRRLRLYHCLLCQTGFSTLETFLSHCQSHLKERVEQERADSDAT